MWKGLIIESKLRNNRSGGPGTFDDQQRPNDQLFFNKQYAERRLPTGR
jgi:hypothetical protein